MTNSSNLSPSVDKTVYNNLTADDFDDDVMTDDISMVYMNVHGFDVDKFVTECENADETYCKYLLGSFKSVKNAIDRLEGAIAYFKGQNEIHEQKIKDACYKKFPHLESQGEIKSGNAKISEDGTKVRSEGTEEGEGEVEI